MVCILYTMIKIKANHLNCVEFVILNVLGRKNHVYFHLFCRSHTCPYKVHLIKITSLIAKKWFY